MHVTGYFPLKDTLDQVAQLGAVLASNLARFGSAHAGFDHRACAFRTAAQRRFVASMIALRPAALSFRFLRAGAAGAASCFLDVAHLFR